MVYNPCGCWNLKDGGVTIGIWSVVYACIEFCLFGWQTYDIKEERNKVAMWRQPSVGAVDPLAARWNVYYNQYAETDLEQHYLRVFIIQIINLIVDFFVLGSSIALMVGVHTGSKHLIWPWFPCMCISICTTLAYCIMWWAYRVESYWVVLTIVEMASVIINIYCVWCIATAYRLIVSGKAFQTVTHHNEKKHMLVSADTNGALQSKVLPSQIPAGQLNQAYMQTPTQMPAGTTIYATKQPQYSVDSYTNNSMAQKQTKIDFNLPAPYAYQQEQLSTIQLPNGMRLVPMPMPPPQYQQSVVEGPVIGASGKTDFIKSWQIGVEDAAIGAQSFPSEEPPLYNPKDISDHFTSVSKSTRRSSRDDPSKSDRKHRHRHRHKRSPSTQYDSDSRNTTATKTSRTSKSSRSRRRSSRRRSSSEEQSESSETSSDTSSYTKGRSKSATNLSERTYRTGQSSKSSSKNHRRRRRSDSETQSDTEGVSTTVVSTAKSHSSRTSASSKSKSKTDRSRRHRSHSVDDRDDRERRSEKNERRRERNSPKDVKKKSSSRYRDEGSTVTSRSYQSRSVDQLSHLPSSEPISPALPLNIPMSAVQAGLYQTNRVPPATPVKPKLTPTAYVTPPRSIAQPPPPLNRSTSAGPVRTVLNQSGSSSQPPTTPPGNSGSGQTAVYTSSGSSGAGRQLRLNSSGNEPAADNKVYISTAV